MTIYNYLSPILRSSSPIPDKQLRKDGKDPVRNDAFYKTAPQVNADVSIDDKFLTPTKFSMEIERLVKSSKGLISYIEAVVTYCQENEIEVETVSKLVTKPLKERLRHEAERLNYMKKRSKGVLPL